MPLSRHSVRTYQATSSYATHQGTLGHSRLSSLSHCGLILALSVELVWRANLYFKREKEREREGGREIEREGEREREALAGNDLSNILKKSSHTSK